MSKKNFILRIDMDTFNALSKWASDEFRSVNGQIEMILDKAVKESGRSKLKVKTSLPTQKIKSKQ
jgi:hypothetical protein